MHLAFNLSHQEEDARVDSWVDIWISGNLKWVDGWVKWMVR